MRALQVFYALDTIKDDELQKLIMERKKMQERPKVITVLQQRRQAAGVQTSELTNKQPIKKPKALDGFSLIITSFSDASQQCWKLSNTALQVMMKNM